MWFVFVACLNNRATHMTSLKLYSERELDELGILCRATRWRLRGEGKFPQPIVISKGRKAYLSETIEEWLQNCPKAGGGSYDD